MNRSRAIANCLLLGVCVLTTTAMASIPNQYQTIVDRNSFGLNPPPPVDTSAPPPTPPANVKVSGFSRMGGELKAYFVITGKEQKDTQYLSLGENQREGVLEVLKIMEDTDEVKVRNAGTEVTLSLKSNNMNPPPKLGPGVTAVNNVPPPPPLPGGQPGAAAAPSTVFDPTRSTSVVNYVKPGTEQSPQAPIPGQPPQVQPQPGLPAPGAPGQPTTGLRTIPTRTLRLPPTSRNP